MFRPLYRPSSGCTLSYYKANYTIYNVFVFVNEIWCTCIKFAFKIITLAVELKIYSNMKRVNSIKSWVLWSQEGEGGWTGCVVSSWVYSCLAVLVFSLVFHGGTVNWLWGNTVMVSSCQMLHGGRSPTVVVVLISRRCFKYIYFIVQLESPGLKCYCRVEYIFWTCGNTEWRFTLVVLFYFSSVNKVECYIGIEIIGIMSFLFSNIKKIVLTC